MPTYAFRCELCGRIDEHVMSIGDYVRNAPVFFCCRQPMQRHINVVPGLALGYALAGERHYEGLRATDGTDIGTRAKHRAYMRAHNLTTADDFASTWKRAEQERAGRLQGDDPQRAQDVAQAVARLGG